MTGKTHDVAAFTALGAVVYLQPLGPITVSTAIIALLANQLGGIAPDIDQPTAPFWRNLPIGGIFGKITGKMLGGHRFLSHSVIGVALFGFLSWLLLEFLSPLMPHTNIGYVWWAFMIGVVSHLVMDTFTKEGVPWLLPIPVKFGIPPVKSWRITTGKKLELLVILPGLIALNIWFWAQHYDYFVNFIHSLYH